ncbi:hypothetical protein H6P81_003256 [Aristolochia fimbriata]|uniref:Pentatricopeptide repeat-containing protein n=1 Tax=Aristolochia fimbriata TaxID=158543 RepID=A0AAV7FGH3_ARIFI|nr:hypothetical protein H6P81_003256 [Aristolochia fimbriata]
MRQLLHRCLEERNPCSRKASVFFPGLCTKVYIGDENHSGVGGDDDEEEESISVRDRSYWSQKIQVLCGDEKPKVDQALTLLHRLHLRGYRPDSLDLVVIILALCRTGRFPEAHRRLLLSPSYPDDHQTCNSLLSQLLRANTPHLTFRVLRRMTDADPAFVPSISIYNRLVHQFGSVSQPKEAQQVLMHLQTRGLFLNGVTYTSLIGGFCQCGDLESACRLFDEMRIKGITPNSLTYTVLCRGYLNNRKVAEAMKLMNELWVRMRDVEGTSINAAAFANLIEALCHNRMFHEVFRIAEDMPQGNCVCEEFAYSQMIDSLCRAGRNHGASRIVYIMRKRGFIPPLLSYNSIIHGLSKEGEGGCMRAYQLFEEGITFGYSPPEPTYKVIVEGLCQVNDLAKARYLVDFMLKQENNDKTRIYNIFLGALCFMNNPTELLNLLVSMLQNGCRPDIVTLNTVICAITRGLCNAGKLSEARDFLYELVDCGIRPKIVSYNILIDKASSMGLKREAYQIMKEMKDNAGLEPDAVTWRTLDKLHKHSFAKSPAPVESLDDEMVKESSDMLIGQDKTGSNLNEGTNKLGARQVFPEPKLQQDASEDAVDSLNVETGEEALRGLVDSDFTGDRLKEYNGAYNDVVREITKLSRAEKREPLSKLARRVFGLL